MNFGLGVSVAATPRRPRSGSSLRRRRQSDPYRENRCRRISFLSVVHDHRPLRAVATASITDYCVGSGLSRGPARRLPLRRLRRMAFTLASYCSMDCMTYRPYLTSGRPNTPTLARSPELLRVRRIRLRTRRRTGPKASLSCPADWAHIPRHGHWAGVLAMAAAFLRLVALICGGHSRSRLVNFLGGKANDVHDHSSRESPGRL